MITLVKKALQRPLWQQILTALVLGTIVGLTVGDVWIKLIEPIGVLFINAIKMVMVPVVFVSIVAGVISLGDPRTLGRIGSKTMGFYFGTMALANVLGIIIALLLGPGKGLDFSGLGEFRFESIAVPSFREVIESLIPSNPFMAFADNNILQVVVFAIFIGIAITSSREKGKVVASFFLSLAEVIHYLPRFIMMVAPIGVFALIATPTASFVLAALKELFAFILAVYAGCAIQLLVVFPLMLKFLAGVNPKHFFKGIATAMSFAFSTSSSAATLPYTLECAKRNLGVSEGLADFILPLGATANMNGLAVYLGVAAVFAANLFGVELSIAQYLMVVIMGTLAAIGAAGVPGTFLVVLPMILGVMGLGATEVAILIGLFAGVDRVVEMVTTTVNVTGDAVVAVVVAKQENQLDEAVYYSPNLFEKELSAEMTDEKTSV